MDRKTLAAYDSDAAAFAKDWHDQPARSICRKSSSGFSCAAALRPISAAAAAARSAGSIPTASRPWVLTSEGLLAEARRRYPGMKFAHAELPDLKGIGTFDNVLCETVIMHLDCAQIAPRSVVCSASSSPAAFSI